MTLKYESLNEIWQNLLTVAPDRYHPIISVQTNMTPGSYRSREGHIDTGKKKELEAIIAVITAPKALIVFFAGNVNEWVPMILILLINYEPCLSYRKKLQCFRPSLQFTQLFAPFMLWHCELRNRLV